MTEPKTVKICMDLPCLYPCIVTVQQDEDGDLDVVGVDVDMVTGNVCHAVPIDGGLEEADHEYAVAEARKKLEAE